MMLIMSMSTRLPLPKRVCDTFVQLQLLIGMHASVHAIHPIGMLYVSRFCVMATRAISDLTTKV